MSYRNALTERLIKILFSLIRRESSRQELANEHGVNVKTIDRFLLTINSEFPIITKKRGREVYYKFAEDSQFNFPKFSVEEVATLLLAQESIAGIGITAQGSIYGQHAETLLEKLKKSLPPSIRLRMEALSKVYGSAVVPAKDFSRHTEKIDRLASCAIRRKKVSVNYYGLNSNSEKTRIWHPYNVYFDPDGATLKVIAFDEKHQELRVFSIERILNFKELEQTFTRSNDFNLKTYLDENCFNGIHGKPLTVQLKAKGVTARIFAERKFHPSQKVIERKQKRGSSPETITIEMRLASGRGLERFIIGWLPEIEVISPKELRESVKQTLLKGLENF